MQPILIWCLLGPEQIKDNAVLLPCGGDVLPLTIQPTFYRSGVHVGDAELVGVQLESEVVEDFLRASGSDDLSTALASFKSLEVVDFYECNHGEEDTLFDRYPDSFTTKVVQTPDGEQLISNFTPWGGVL